MDMTLSRFGVTPLGRTLAAEIKGLDLKAELDDATVAELRAAWLRHGVLVFRGQSLDDAQQVDFTLRFGALEDVQIRLDANRVTNSRFIADLSNLDDDGKILSAGAEKLQFQKGNQFWHTDSSFKPVPSGPSFLSARIIPPEGGETEFADLRAAYDELPDVKKQQLEGLVAEHSIFHSRARYGYTKFSDAERARWKPVFHPLVRRHPETGRKTLYLGAHAGRILGMEDRAANALIDELIAFATQERFVYRHRWDLGDLVMWDNRCTMHRGKPWDEARYRRNMRRTTVAGDGPTVQGGKPIDEYAARAHAAPI